MAGIRPLTALSVLGNDPEVVGAPDGRDPIFDHLPEAYLGILNAGGLLDDHLQVLKQELLDGELPDDADPSDQEAVEELELRDHADLGDTFVPEDVMAEVVVKEEVTDLSSEDEE